MSTGSEVTQVIEDLNNHIEKIEENLNWLIGNLSKDGSDFEAKNAALMELRSAIKTIDIAICDVGGVFMPTEDENEIWGGNDGN